MLNRLIKIYENHQKLRQNSINLLPSENVLSPLAKKFLASDMGQRYFFKKPFLGGNGISYSYSGTMYIEELIDMGESVAKKLFAADYVSLYPVSGHQANIAVLLAFTKPGDTIMAFNSNYGGYPGLDENKLPKYLNLKVVYFEVDKSNPELIDYQNTYNLIDKIRPKLVIYSSAHTLFPIDIKSLSSKSHEVGALFVYDGSHPLGLIAGGLFQKPLQEGADILIAGTQKSFPGPQGGIIATNNYAKQLDALIHFVIVDNPHFHRIGALTAALLEMEKYGNEYAKQVIKNAKHLASCLYSKGFKVRYMNRGYTESHMFKLEIGKDYMKFAKQLENANIMIDTAGRIGVAELTRLGMKEKEMEKIASFMYKVYTKENIKIIKRNVIAFKQNFKNVNFCFK